MLFLNFSYKINLQGGDRLHTSKNEVIQNLKDAGFDEDLIEQFISLYQLDRSTAYMRLLRKYRCNLLSDMRVCQEKLFCLDYLIRRLKTKDKL